MLKPTYDEAWPESWRSSYHYDEIEVWNSGGNLGHQYQYGMRRSWALRAVKELAPSGGAILDVAGASGNFSLPLAEAGYHVTWNDLRSELAGFVKQKQEFGEVEFSPGNIFDLANKWTSRFDVVLAAEVIEHMAHPDQFLACLAGVLKPGGVLVLTTPNGRYFRCNHPRFSECPDPSIFESVQFKPDADGHIFLLDRKECCAMAANAGFAVERIILMANPLTAGHVKLSYVLPYLPAGAVRALENFTQKTPQFIRERICFQMLAVLLKPKGGSSAA